MECNSYLKRLFAAPPQYTGELRSAPSPRVELARRDWDRHRRLLDGCVCVTHSLTHSLTRSTGCGQESPLY